MFKKIQRRILNKVFSQEEVTLLKNLGSSDYGASTGPLSITINPNTYQLAEIATIFSTE